MDGGSLLEKKPITLTLIIFTFLCFLFLGARAQADTYCVGCPGASAADCDGNAACGAPCDDPMAMGFNCPTIENALDCIATNMDPDAEIRIAQNPTMPLTPYTGPGSSNPINNTAMMMDQEIKIQGGWDAMDCTSQTIPLDPTNTIIEAPSMDRVFLINNTMSDLLTVALQGLTITGGDSMSVCGASSDGGGGVCVASTGTGGVSFKSISNIYDGNTAGVGGGLEVSTDGGGDISATIMNDIFTNNSATFDGGGISLTSETETLNATIDNATIGGDDPFPNGGNEADIGGGISIRGVGGVLNVKNQGNTITKNTTLAGGDTAGGAGILILNDDLVMADPIVTVSIEKDTITFNEADGEQGGGISIQSFPDSTVNVSISMTEIGNNSAGTFGGGIALEGGGNINTFTLIDSISKAVENNIIHHNIAEGSPVGGGGVAAVTSGMNANFDIKFVNNTIADNQAPNSGGQGGGILADNTANGVINWTLPNDIIFFNISAGTGDQIALVENGTTCMPPSPADCATIAVRFTDISNAPDDIVGDDSTGVGFVNLVDPNIFNIDPQFIDHFNGDYRITSDSPVATAGTKTPILTIAGVEADPPDFDIVGTPRDISMGPYEPLPSPSPTPTPTVTPTPSPTPTTPPPPTPTPTIAPPTPTPTPQDMLVFSNANNGKIVTIQSEPGTTIQGGPLGKTLEGCPKVINDKFVTFPVGTYEYFITGLNPGDATMVVIELPPGTEVNSYFVFGKKPGDDQDHCYEFLFDGTTGAQIMDGLIVVHHVDGGLGDDDLDPNGVIVDPAAPAFLSDAPPGTGNGCSIASTVNSGSAALNLFIPLIPAIAVGIRYLGRRRRK